MPENIVGFLDFFGHWKPALAGVMGGALGVYALLYPLVLKRKVPLFAPSFDLPGPGKPSARLLTGAALFGVGWGLSGVCPGPAVAALVTGAREAVVFAVALAAGISLFHLAFRPGDPGSCG